MRRKKLLIAVLAALTIPVGAGLALAAGTNNPLTPARQATDRYHDISVATSAGYAELRDAAGIACIDLPGVGAMGVHFVNGGLVGDAVLNPATPEALVYEPRTHGGYKLVALEYIVFKSAWEAAGHTGVPSLFGTDFALTPSPNRFGLDPFYSLHAWLFRGNPLGQLTPWNPRVSC
jgi:hypothetical protein